MLPFFDLYLKDRKPAKPIPPVRAFMTGRNEWRSYESWPPAGGGTRKLYLLEGHGLGFTPSTAKNSFDEYVSDPSKPVPYRVQPIVPNDAADTTWDRWLVDDQRPFGSRPDVLTYVSEPLTEPLVIAGPVNAHLKASTTGTDADWVVKLIDVYRDEVPEKAELGGYQLMVSADIARGRYRESLATAKPIRAGAALEYSVRMPNAHHTFLPGHRLMVQIQSSWFPLYDRNPQTFVDNIAYAPREAYRKATQRVYRDSFIMLETQSPQ
jgi:putative CocE/NonD family hydrolase